VTVAKKTAKSSKGAAKAKAEPKAKAKAKVEAKAEPKAKAKAKVEAKAKPAAKAKAAEPRVEKAKAEPKGKAAAKAKAEPKGKKGKAEGAVVEKSKKPWSGVRKGHLVVVESPAKARTIKKYLGPGYVVKASVGHVMDLPKSRIGVDVKNGFEPEYVVIENKAKVIGEIRDAAQTAEGVFLAPDPDREGEAIAWHIAEQIKDVNPKIQRVLFNEITKKGVTAALQVPTVLNTSKTDAQQARRILDRLVGYEISPLLWKKVRRGLSAGRVQSVAVRLVVDREKEIAEFKPDEYWTVDCDCAAGSPPPFTARIFRFRGEKAEPKTAAEAETIAAELRAGSAHVALVEKKERRRRPQPPFITSRLQQEAARKLRFTAKKTMALAQRLYEGLDLGEEGASGLITYMRTDSTRISDDALAGAREFIAQRYGKDLLPEEPIIYKTSKSAQDAHEAIRPTSMELPPEKVAELIQAHPEASDLTRLYTLIWNRFIACQMTPAVYDQTQVDIVRGDATLRATGQVLKFAGFTSVYLEQETEDEASEKAAESDRLLPALAEGDAVTLEAIRPEQHFTQPPPRFTEASLVKELEERGIGRPSTYAAIMSTIVDRGYTDKRDRRFFPTELGTLVNGLLVESFPEIVDFDFTAQMEQGLDKVEDGERDWRVLLQDFYTPFSADLVKAKEAMRDVKREEIATDHVCEKCGKPMVIKFGRNGSFLACQGYPECRNTKEITRGADGKIEIVPEATTDELCPECGAAMKVKRGRFGSFLACSRYPDCKTTRPISLGVVCPKEGCGGFLTEKRSRRGKVFFGCSNYSKTQCDFVTWDRPINEACPDCGAKFLVKKENRSGTHIRCLTCEFKKTEGEAAA
jgi:DNA topoisomerase-1